MAYRFQRIRSSGRVEGGAPCVNRVSEARGEGPKRKRWDRKESLAARLSRMVGLVYMGFGGDCDGQLRMWIRSVEKRTGRAGDGAVGRDGDGEMWLLVGELGHHRSTRALGLHCEHYSLLCMPL